MPFIKGWLYSWPAFLVWNGITTYWIGYCTVAGAIGAIVANSLLQAWVFGFWHCCRNQIKREWIHPILFVAFWISFEYLHLNWDLTWPWLNLGNVFAVCPRWVQWYSVTGAFGGALWILTLNFLLFYLLKHQRKTGQRAWGHALAFFLVLLIPGLISGFLYKGYEKRMDKSRPIEAVVVQQNTDPWEEEYILSNEEQVQRLIDVSGPYITERTNLIVCPESSVPHNLSLPNIQHNNYPEFNNGYSGFRLLDSVIRIYPHLNYILGLSTFELFDYKASNTCRPAGQNLFVDVYNTACCYNKNRYNGHYHKSRLVPGVEKMPFPKLLGFLGDAIIELGGSNSSLGTDTEQRTFTFDLNGTPAKVGTAICYESIYGELCGKFVRNGANVLTVITNDSWWDDSQGHKQHFEMSRLRAVETRRYVLRAANGGFSGIIDPTGNVLQKTNYDERIALKETVFAQDHQTFYVKHGDYIAKLAIILSAIGFLYTLIIWMVSLINPKKRL